MKMSWYWSLISFAAVILPVSAAGAQNHNTYEQCMDVASQNYSACSDEAFSDAATNVWGGAAAGAAAGGLLGGQAVQGAVFGGFGAIGIEAAEQLQCGIEYWAQRSGCSDLPESSYYEQQAPSSSEQVIELDPIYIFAN